MMKESEIFILFFLVIFLASAVAHTLWTDDTSYFNCTGIMYYNIWLYDEDGDPADGSLSIVVYNPNLTQMDSKSGSSSGGMYNNSYQVNETATTGNWTIETTSSGGIDRHNFTVS